MAHENAGVTNLSQEVMPTNGHRPKVLNLRTYKLHALGDYVVQIRMFGTTDSYSTQPVGHITVISMILPSQLRSSGTPLHLCTSAPPNSDLGKSPLVSSVLSPLVPLHLFL